MTRKTNEQADRAGATGKALAAYHSELRRLARALAAWDEDLRAREAAIEGREDGEELPCGCTYGDAADGCDCSPCEAWRLHVGRSARTDEPAPAPGEVDFLEKLYRLKDKRKSKQGVL